MSLIIVESPSKINKITTYANANGGHYTTAATVGHLLDLVKYSNSGIVKFTNASD